MEDFIPMPKIARLSRKCVITEKLDGTNAQVFISEEGEVQAGSRGRYITKEDDNFGFARWVEEHSEELVVSLGPGRHFGEWWGLGIQRGYNQIEKKFSLFPQKVIALPDYIRFVPTLYKGPFDTFVVEEVLRTLQRDGSRAAPGYPFPEGVVIYHKAAGVLFKKTIEKDEEPKGKR